MHGFIDIAKDDDNNIVVIVCYSDASIMATATASAQDAFVQMIMQGAAKSSSIEQWTGEVVMSF